MEDGAGSVATPDSTTDRTLARLAGLGDRDAFEVIVRRHGQSMFRYARRTLVDVGDAQEVVQDAFVAAWRSIDGFDGRSSLRTWLFTITARKAIDRRRRSRAVPIDDQLLTALPAGSESDPFAHASRSELLTALDDALAELPYGQRACWLLTQVEGLTQHETATVLSTTPDAVRGQLFRARRNLSERMARWR